MKKTTELSGGKTETLAKDINASIGEAERFHDAAVRELSKQ